MTECSIELISSTRAVREYLPLVCAAADQERRSFGFLPPSAYEKFAVQERLIIARKASSGELAGYVIFGGTAPQGRIFQTYVAPAYRRQRIGKLLVNEVVRRLEASSYLSIRVEVASDLEHANRFYRDQQFRKVREKRGGATTGRTLITRVRELAAPSLLDVASFGSLHGPAVSINVRPTSKTPLFLIDLNVLFDVTKKRGRALAAGRIFAAALDNSVVLAASNEFIHELERNTKPGQPDPVLELARNLPLLRKPSPQQLAVFRNELGQLLFPDRFARDRLTTQDESDIAHISTAIQENADGFITSEKAILSLNEWFLEKYSLQVISPEVFGKHYTSTARISAGYRVNVRGRRISVSELSEADEQNAHLLVEEQDLPKSVAKEALSCGTSLSPRRRLAFRADENLVAFCSWDTAKKHDIDRRLYLFANERDPDAELAVDHLLDLACRDVRTEGPTLLRLNPAPDQVLVRSSAISKAFRPQSGESPRVASLEKLCLGQIVSDRNWPQVRDTLKQAVGIVLPESAPPFRSPEDEIRISSDGRGASISLGAFEDFLYPALFSLSGRPAVIVPIRASFAEDLFRGSQQPSFLDGRPAALMSQRRYVSSSATYSIVPDRGLIAFYESASKGGGRSAAIAIGRILRRYLAQELVAKELVDERGVVPDLQLTRMARGREVCITEFDSIMIFDKPVGLTALKAMGCADKANLVTARRIGAASLNMLLEAGRPRCTR